MKECRNCKTQNDDSAKYCRSCGKEFKDKSKDDMTGLGVMFWIILALLLVVCDSFKVPVVLSLICVVAFIFLGIWAFNK